MGKLHCDLNKKFVHKNFHVDTIEHNVLNKWWYFFVLQDECLALQNKSTKSTLSTTSTLLPLAWSFVSTSLSELSEEYLDSISTGCELLSHDPVLDVLATEARSSW